MRHGESGDRRTAHAAAHEMRALHAQMIEQARRLTHVMLEGDALHAPARLAAFAPVEGDAGEVLREPFERLHLRVNAKARPLLDNGVEAAGRKQKQWRAGARHLIARAHAVDVDESHGVSP